MTINKVYHFFICLEEKKKKKKSGFTKLLNLLSPRSKRRVNYGRDGVGEDDDNNDDDDDNNNHKSVPRKTLVTATIGRESDAANANVPGGGALNGSTTKLTDMYSSLTFKQEILGAAAADKDDGVEAKPEDNNHQDEDDDDDNDNDGDGGGFAGSVNGYQSGALGMPPIMGLGSPPHSDDKDGGPLTFADPLGDCQGSAELLAKAEERELMMGFFKIVQRTAQKKRGNVTRCWGHANSK
jgi:hypothetical protein